MRVAAMWVVVWGLVASACGDADVDAPVPVATSAVDAVAKPEPESDAERLGSKRDRFRKARKAEGMWPFLDLSYAVTWKSSRLDSRWSCQDPPPGANNSEQEGLQFYATWESKIGSGADITVAVQKWEQKNSAEMTVATLNFENIGETCEVAELQKVCNFFSREWKQKATEPVEQMCSKKGAEKARGMGPAKWYAFMTATDPETKQRERHEWFVWSTENTTWMAHATYKANTLDKPDWLAYGTELVKAMKELKAPN